MNSIAPKPVENLGDYLWKTPIISWKTSISIITLWKSRAIFPQVFHNLYQAEVKR
jgi:hypothetical protein